MELTNTKVRRHRSRNSNDSNRLAADISHAEDARTDNAYDDLSNQGGGNSNCKAHDFSTRGIETCNFKPAPLASDLVKPNLLDGREHDFLRLGNSACNATHVLGVRVNLISYELLCAQIADWIQTRQQSYCCFTNPHSIIVANGDRGFREATNQSDLTLPDGVGVVLAAQLKRIPHHGRVTGPTSMLNVCECGVPRGWKHFLLGGAPGVPERLGEKLQQLNPGMEIVGTHSPPFRPLSEAENKQLIEMINESEADILWIGLGAPKQEKWMQQFRSQLETPVLMGVGAAFDFHSGNKSWAPAWVRKIGCEWLIRLIQEPKRLAKRNLHSFLFCWKLLADD